MHNEVEGKGKCFTCGWYSSIYKKAKYKFHILIVDGPIINNDGTSRDCGDQ